MVVARGRGVDDFEHFLQRRGSDERYYDKYDRAN